MDLLLLYLRSFVIGPYLKGKEEIPDDMARAILDIPSMPQNCYECPMRRMYRRKWFCQIIMHKALKDQRRPDCPLVEMDVKASNTMTRGVTGNVEKHLNRTGI